MKIHSVTDIITNSSTVLFTVNTDMNYEQFELKIRQLYAIASELPYPFTIKYTLGGWEFNAGYYWGFTGFDNEQVDEEKDEEMFTHLLITYFGQENVHKQEIG